ncbi:DUF3231 family protein [Metabacillus sp. B2-18]|uniref:DUF3231 family protein n=1 Tax=Metabacillus sp. B2-18 TaxID=2897333 RepID=UPI001E60148D|nr:DUF3231 family protein [Metabacillus sp. B2-18]UGB32127.1 DUF3231 family protein [Metabacillus sp. B2-18]
MNYHHKPKLTSTEISFLWTTFIQDSLAICILEYFKATRMDEDLDPSIDYGLHASNSHLNHIKTIFNNEEIPIPIGFKVEQDFFTNGSRLFPDVYMFRFLEHMARGGLTNYAMARSTTYRKDVRQFAQSCLDHSSNLYDLVIETAQNKGILVRSPSIAYPVRVEYVQKAKFFSDGFLDEDRPLLGVEISHLGTNIEASYVVATTLLGYAQVASDKKLSQLFVRGYEIAKKHSEIFSSILRKENVHAPADWDSSITNATKPGLSDRLMVNNIASMISIGMSNYGTAVGATLRKDLLIHYARLSAELGQYAEDLAELMIRNRWMEKPPQVINREELINKD